MKFTIKLIFLFIGYMRTRKKLLQIRSKIEQRKLAESMKINQNNEDLDNVELQVGQESSSLKFVPKEEKMKE